LAISSSAGKNRSESDSNDIIPLSYLYCWCELYSFMFITIFRTISLLIELSFLV